MSIMRLKDLGATAAIIKQLGGASSKYAEKILAIRVAEGALTKEQGALAASLLKTSSGANGLSLAFKGLWSVVAAHPFVAIAAAIGVLAVAVGRYKENIKDSYREIMGAGKKVNEEEKASRDAYSEMKDVYDAYQLGTKTKEELTGATDKFVESLGMERWQIQGLKDDYSNLIEVMSKYHQKKLADDRGELIKSVKAAKDLAVADPREIGSTATLFTAIRRLHDNYNSAEQLDLLDLLVSEASDATSGLAKKLDLKKDADGNYVLSLKGDFAGAEGLVNLVNTAKEVKNELYDLASDKGIGDSLYENWVWNYVNNIEDTLGELAGGITDAERNLAENIAGTVLAQNGKIPQSIDEYYNLRDAIIDAVGASDLLKDSTIDVASVVDSVLSSYSFSTKFSSGINKFKHDFNSLKNDIKTAIEDMLKSGEELTDEQAEQFAEWAHSLGYSVDEVKEYLTRMVQEMEGAANTDIVSRDIAGLATLRDELKKTEEAFEEYNKILEGGDRGDTAKKMAEAYQKAIDDLDKGRIDTKAVWGAAKLLFSDEQLAAWGYDLSKIAAQLRGPMMEALFGKGAEDDDTDIGVKFANYIREHAGELGDAIELIDQGSGKFTFIYKSLAELAKNLGMSEDALTGLLDALDAYGVSSVRSTEETRQLAQTYDEIYRSLSNVGGASERTTKAVKEFVKQMYGDGMTEPEILNVLNTLRESGVIGQSVDSLNDIIHDTVVELKNVDQSDANPTIDANTSPAHSAIDSLVARLEALSRSEYHTTIYVDRVEQSASKKETLLNAGQNYNRTPRYASGTRDAKAGRALVNEKGPELISDGGKAYIANGGKPGFTNLGAGAVVFTADETKQIFSRGYSDIPVRAYANGAGSVSDRAGLRERLIRGGNARALAGGYYYITCVNCGASITVTDSGGVPSTCWKCGKNPKVKQSSSSSSSGSGTSSSSSTIHTGSAKTNYKTCPKCGAMCSTGSSKCGNCGYNFNASPVNYKICPICSAQCSTGSSKCGQCGYNFITGESSSSYKPYTPTNTSQVQTNIDYTPPASSYNNGSSGSYTGSGGGTSVGSADYASQSEPQKVDWIAVLLNRVQKAVAALEKIASSGFKKLSTRLTAAKEEVQDLAKEIQKNEEGYERYLQEAEGVGLSEDIAKLVRDGTIDIREYDDETRKLIDSYEEWYEKALDCKYAVEELHQEIADLYLDMFNYTQTDYSNRLAQIEHEANMISKNMEMAKARGYLDSVKYYEQLATSERTNVQMLRNELTELTTKFNEAMSSGEIEENSEAWYEMKAAINEVAESIADANIQLVEYAKTMRSIEWSYFDYAQERFGQLQQEANFLIGIMQNDKLFEENGQYAAKGTATMGLRVSNYNAYMSQADAYAKEMRKVSKLLADDPYDTELIARRETLLGLQQQMIQAAESEKDAIKDLVSQGIQLELSALKDLIDEYEESLDSAKDLYEYQKSISEKTETVAKIQKQISAYEKDDSEENVARMQKLNEQLKKAQEDLRETEWEHGIAETKKLLDEMYDSYSELLNARLDNLEALVEEMTGRVNDHLGEIKDEVRNSARQVGYEITDGMNQVLGGGGFAYYDEMFEGVSSANKYLASINSFVAQMANASDSRAKQTASYTGTTDSQSGGTGGNAVTSEPVKRTAFADVEISDPNNRGVKNLMKSRVRVLDEFLDQYKSDPSNRTYQNLLAVEILNVLKHAEAAHIDTGDPIQTALSQNGWFLETEILDELLKRIQEGKYDSNPFKAFSTGGLADYTGPAILHGSKQRPELVLNADDTEKFMAAAKLMRTPMLSVLLDKGFRIPELGIGGGGGLTIENFTADFNFEHVESYDDFLRQAQKDKRFERLVTTITSDQYVNGRSKLGKFQQRL